MVKSQRDGTSEAAVDVLCEGSSDLRTSTGLLQASHAASQIAKPATDTAAAHNETSHVRIPAFGRSTLKRETPLGMPNGIGASREKYEVWWVALWVQKLLIMIVLSIAAVALEQAFGWVGKVIRLLIDVAKYLFK